MAGGTRFRPVRLSLRDILGRDYVNAVVSARSRLTGEPKRAVQSLATEKVDLFPASFQQALVRMLPKVGRRIGAELARSPAGATTRFFSRATRIDQAPVTGWGYYRVGQDGRLYFLSKSEHYHAPMGHGFPGYRLLDLARRLGIPNATHNNTRGHITRLLEEELVRTANGLARGDHAGLKRVVRSRRPGVLNRVLNLETGSLAVEAGIKMMLGRFYKAQADSPAPKYAGRIPVLAVIGDDAGGLAANYHGTTVIAQVLRDMWPVIRDGLDGCGLLKVVAVRPNSLDDLEAVFRRFDRRRFKLAGFLLEPVLMNYGGRRLDERFVSRINALCRRRDVPVMVDEIQTCLWSPRLYMFREHGFRPTMAAVGKGLPGGEYAASRIVFNASMDCLPQFGALVTNGQEELASLAYLITMAWAEANSDITAAVGEEYERRLRALAGRHPDCLAAVEGCRHLVGLHFRDLERARAFVKRLVAGGLDISVQTYKTECLPAALTKLPLIAGFEAVDMVVAKMAEALEELGKTGKGEGGGSRDKGRVTTARRRSRRAAGRPRRPGSA